MATTNITVTPGDAQTAALISAAENADGALVSGQLRCANVLVTFGGTDHAADDVINLVRLPKGATVLVDLLVVRVTDAAAAALVIDLGDDDATTAVDPDRYLDGTTATNAGVATKTVGVAAATPYTLQAASWIQLKLMTVTTAEAGAVRLLIPYIVRN